MGSILAICTSAKKGVKKTTRATASFVENHGIDGDAHAGDWHRQVSLLDERDIQEMREKGLPDLAPGAFGENVVVNGVDLGQLGLGSRIALGDAVELSLTQLGKVCHHRCAIFYQTGDCIMPRQGIFARVLKGGEAAVGAPVEVVERIPRETYQAVVLTISDRCSRGAAEDTAGPAVAAILREGAACHVYGEAVLPDEQSLIEERLKHYCNGHSIDLVLAVGGTGFAPRDVTPEAATAVIERPTPGLAEAMRTASLRKTPHAMLSRAVCGIRGRTLIVTLPGSERAASENLQAILPALPHGLAKLRGDPSDCGPAE